MSASEPAAARDGALKARQGTKSEAMYPPNCHLKPGAIGGRVATLPAAPHPRQALLLTMRSLADWLLNVCELVQATKMQ